MIKKAGLTVCALFIAGNVMAADMSRDGRYIAKSQEGGATIAAAKMTDQQRIMRLERILDSGVLHEQKLTIQALREELSAMHELVEQQQFVLESMKQRQRNLYLDMDRRINNVETGGRNNIGAVAPVAPPNVAAPGAVTAGDKDGQEAYSKAFALLKEGRYEQSIKAFESFKISYPGSKYADNAQYWLAEAYYVSLEYKKALTAFQRLIALYPDSSKIPGARLKIGYIYFELKNWSAARDALQQVISSYPDATVAKKADERMQRIEREGN